MMRRLLYLFVLLVVAAATPANAAWREASSTHFVIYSEQSSSSLQGLAESLERYDQGLRALWGRTDETRRAARVTIFVLPNKETVRRLIGPKAGSSLAGFYLNLARGPVAFVPRSSDREDDFGIDSQLIQHEYAHHFMYQNFTGVFPAWFTEGFAEFAGTAERKKDAIGFGLPAQNRAGALLLASPIPIEKLLTSLPPYNDPREVDKFYGRGWLLCHYLLTDADRRGKLSNYLVRINAREDSLSAARAAFGDLAQLDRELNRYKGQSLRYYPIPISALSIGKVTIRELGPGEAAIMEVRIQSRSGVSDQQEAAKVLAMARKASAPYPNDPAVQRELAEAEFAAGNLSEAEAAADRAIAADPKAIEALTFKGMARMRQTVMASKRDAETWGAVRRIFLAANRIDPDDPEPLAYFFLSHLRQGIEPTPNAVDAAVRALELAPQNVIVRMNLVQYYLVKGKAAEARANLIRVASNPHGGLPSQTASNMLAALDRGGPPAALAIMRQGNPAASPGTRGGS